MVMVVEMLHLDRALWKEVQRAQPGYKADPIVDEGTRHCISCHSEQGAGKVIVEQWKNSKHAEVGVGCLECHKADKDDPDAFEHELLVEHLDELIAGNTIRCPVYCYNTHTRKADVIELNPAKVLIVEGILLLSNKSLIDRFDIKVYMDTPLDLCLIRRIQRDVIERGRSLDSIIKQYSETVRPMFYQFIEPSKSSADISISRGGKNRIAIDLLKVKISQLSKLY